MKRLHPVFERNYYLFRRKVFKIFGGAFHVYDEQGALLLYSKQKAFKLKEDFRIFSDESMKEELLTIKTPQILDFGATYTVRDATTGETVGSIRRKAIKSIFKDEWVFANPEGVEQGKLSETSLMRALISRVIKLVPQKYVVVASDGRTLSEIARLFNPFVLKFAMSITEQSPAIDRRLLIAAGILLAGIEGRQN